MISRTNAEQLPITMILENIRNPDIIGALTRVAASLGCKKIITIKVSKNLVYFVHSTYTQYSKNGNDYLKG